jgi:hypothetical protein
MDCKDGAHSRGSLTGDRSRFSRHDHLFLSPFPEKKELLRISDKTCSSGRLTLQHDLRGITDHGCTLLHNVHASGAQEFLRHRDHTGRRRWNSLRNIRCAWRVSTLFSGYRVWTVLVDKNITAGWPCHFITLSEKIGPRLE